MRQMRRKRQWIPPWNMPSDPVKALFWFLHWLLKLVVPFFWIPVLVGVIYESFLNGIVGCLLTLLVGLVVWGGLALALFIFNIGSAITETIDQARNIQDSFSPRSPFFRFSEPDSMFNDNENRNENVVEGTLTDLEEERRKRRRE